MMTLLEMAEALDSMEEDVTSWEADFLESVLVRLREGRSLTPGQEAKLRELYKRYLDDDGDGDDDPPAAESPGDFDPAGF